MNITCSGGLAFGWNAWLNGDVLLGGNVGNASLTTTSAVLALPSSHLNSSENLLTVVVDYHGHDETSTTKGVENPRGILGASLVPSVSSSNTGFKQWKINGNAEGSSNIDPARGPMNAGGLYSERVAWPPDSCVRPLSSAGSRPSIDSTPPVSNSTSPLSISISIQISTCFLGSSKVPRMGRWTE